MLERTHRGIPEYPAAMRVFEGRDVDVGDQPPVRNQFEDIIGPAIQFFVKFDQVEDGIFGQCLVDALCDIDGARRR